MTRPVKHALGYIATLAISILLLFLIIKTGSTTSQATSTIEHTEPSLMQSLFAELSRNLHAPLTGLLIQLVVILIFSRICAKAFSWIGQPRVVGEMVAGILLGKSVFAYFWPQGFAAVFPATSMPQLYILSQFGLVLFMFIVGLDLKISDLKSRISAAIVISHASIVVPFLLGALVSLGVYTNYGPKDVSFTSFALFMGIAMSITAFPVLARILQEKKLTNTPLGTMALTCAAVDDVTAWCLLAAIIGVAKAGTAMVAVGVLAASIVYVIAMLKVVRPALEKLLKPSSDGTLAQSQLTLVFGVLLGSALLTELIGIHALFGAFLAGTIMPQNISFRSTLVGKIEDLASVVLLPIFFAYTGLRMEIGLLQTAEAWLVCGGIILVAIVGKMAGSAFAAKWSGMNWRDSWAIGTLMNTRGLMELVVLNIGYDIGILSPTVFAMMVLMALVTTAMTGPILTWILPSSRLTNRPT